MVKFFKEWCLSIIVASIILPVVVGGHIAVFSTAPFLFAIAITVLCFPITLPAIILIFKTIFHEAECNKEFHKMAELKERLVMQYGKDPRELDGRPLEVLRSLHEAQKKIKSASRSY